MEDGERFDELLSIFQKYRSAHGSIVITYDDKEILPHEVVDQVPLYWVIWFNLLRNYILKINHDDRFTDIEQYFALIQLVDEIEVYCYSEDFIVTLPEKEFLLAMLEGYQNFYLHYNRMFSVCPDYWREEETEKLIEIVKRDF